ncbi:MAG: hypothetical protein ACK559_11310, partial [bacterium]
PTATTDAPRFCPFRFLNGHAPRPGPKPARCPPPEHRRSRPLRRPSGIAPQPRRAGGAVQQQERAPVLVRPLQVFGRGLGDPGEIEVVAQVGPLDQPADRVARSPPDEGLVVIALLGALGD